LLSDLFLIFIVLVSRKVLKIPKVKSNTVNQSRNMPKKILKEKKDN
jgi:hypothetical protein